MKSHYPNNNNRPPVRSGYATIQQAASLAQLEWWADIRIKTIKKARLKRRQNNKEQQLIITSGVRHL